MHAKNCILIKEVIRDLCQNLSDTEINNIATRFQNEDGKLVMQIYSNLCTGFCKQCQLRSMYGTISMQQTCVPRW